MDPGLRRYAGAGTRVHATGRGPGPPRRRQRPRGRPVPLLEVRLVLRASRRSTSVLPLERRGAVLFALDHHRGSEENQAGWEWHEPDLVDAALGKMDTLPWFRRTIHDAGLEGTVVASGRRLADRRRRPGRHRWCSWSSTAVTAWSRPGSTTSSGPRTSRCGVLRIHDVFPNPKDGGRPPYEQVDLPG